MKTKITLSFCLLLITLTLSAQSKKELDLRIDTLQTEINNEKQVVQNLTLQIQNLTTELENMNKGILLLTSQVVKQDSMKNNLQKQIHTLVENIESIKRANDSIVKVTEKNIADSVLMLEKNKNQYIQDSIQKVQGVIYCYKSSSSEQLGDVLYTITVEITLTIKNQIAKGNYLSITDRNGRFMDGNKYELSGKVINNVIQAVVVSLYSDQASGWKREGTKKIKLTVGETITWDGNELKKCKN